MREGTTHQYKLDTRHFTESDLVIHAGIPSHPRTPKKRREYIRNSIELFDFARELGANLVFISSHSARSNNPSQYSRDKLYLEEIALDYNFSVVRLGIFSSSVSRKHSLILKFLEFMRFSRLQRISENLPRSCSEELQICLDLISGDSGGRWNCYSFPNNSVEVEIHEVNKNVPYRISPENAGTYFPKRSGTHVVSFVNAMTFSFSDPVFNLMSDLKYYGK
jgi:hypothetical protein